MASLEFFEVGSSRDGVVLPIEKLQFQRIPYGSIDRESIRKRCRLNLRGAESRLHGRRLSKQSERSTPAAVPEKSLFTRVHPCSTRIDRRTLTRSRSTRGPHHA